VPDQPNVDAPGLPARRRNGRRWPGYAVELWQTWSQMPHTVKWSPSDWASALEALELEIRCTAPDAPVSAWVELRAREKAMLMTWDARQSARLRYVALVADSGGDAGSVTELNTYRDL
jgi:hypothetical protein